MTLRTRRTTRSNPFFALVTATGLVALGVACGASSTSASYGSNPYGSGTETDTETADTETAYDTGTDTSGAGGGPPEQHVESSYTAPVATGRYVWIANPTSGRVAYIDAKTLTIKLVDAGDGPTYIAAVPGTTQDVAIVLDVRSLDATILRATSGSITTATVPVPASGNCWAVSSDGRWAIAWTDATKVTSPDPLDGYQDITVVDLTEGAETSYDLSVGYRPSAIAFDAASKHAFAVSQDGITVVALTGATPKVSSNIAISADPKATTAPAVAITPDGSLALVRQGGIADVAVFSLSDGTETDVPLADPPTDVEISGDGSLGVAVVRDKDQGVLLPLPGIATAPATFQTVAFDTTVGSVALASQGHVGLFYTSGVPSPVLSVLDTSSATPTPRDILLRAPILGVFATPDASNAVVLHDALGGSQYAAAVSLVPIALQLPPKVVGLDAAVVSIAVSPAGDHALVAAGDDANGTYQMLVGAFPSLDAQTMTLASMPIAAGIVADAGVGYVAQQNPDGRITFVDFSTGSVRTLTGFELATQVVDGSQ